MWKKSKSLHPNVHAHNQGEKRVHSVFMTMVMVSGKISMFSVFMNRARVSRESSPCSCPQSRWEEGALRVYDLGHGEWGNSLCSPCLWTGPRWFWGALPIHDQGQGKWVKLIHLVSSLNANINLCRKVLSQGAFHFNETKNKRDVESFLFCYSVIIGIHCRRSFPATSAFSRRTSSTWTQR